MTKEERKEIAQKIDKNNKTLTACEDSLLNVSTILNSLKLLKRSVRKVYDYNESAEIVRDIFVVTGDIESIKAELEDVASNAADETTTLKKQLEDLDGVQE